MIPRALTSTARALAQRHPVLTVLGPRQSGKTTLCRALFPAHRYVSLEPLDNRAYARSDPRGFLAELGKGGVIDEIQRAPDLLSYLQAEVDERPAAGRFILIGSQQLALSAAVSQSLAGRTALLELLPLSLAELRLFDHAPKTLWETIWTGGYPRIQQERLPPAKWLADYLATYVERDLRQLLQVGDLATFGGFLKLCAGRTAQELNLAALGADAGVSNHTARAWLSVLEASYLCFRLPGSHPTVRKQVVKSPKLHFYDTGLACQLLGIRTAGELVHHPLRGALFESWVAAEVAKQFTNVGERPRLSHYRQSRGLEVDLLVEGGRGAIALECKSGATVLPEAADSLRRYRAEVAPGVRCVLVHGGDLARKSGGVAFAPWDGIPGLAGAR